MVPLAKQGVLCYNTMWREAGKRFGYLSVTTKHVCRFGDGAQETGSFLSYAAVRSILGLYRNMQNRVVAGVSRFITRNWLKLINKPTFGEIWYDGHTEENNQTEVRK